MSDTKLPPNDQTATAEASRAFARADLACPFGPSFFLGDLGRFVRDRCPDAAEQLPVVQIRLADGETLALCHIMGVSPRWVMLAVHDAASHGDAMAVELAPYEIIRRVYIGTRRAEGTTVGFAQTHLAQIIAPEALLRAVMPPGRDRGD